MSINVHEFTRVASIKLIYQVEQKVSYQNVVNDWNQVIHSMFNQMRLIQPIKCSTTHLTSSP